LHSIKGLDASEPVWLRHCRMIIKEGYAGVPITENGKTRIVSVDHYSASAVVNVYDALKPENKVLFVSKGFMVALKMSWKLIK
jgi:hypothetical protein